jgi:hypothetical protein
VRSVSGVRLVQSSCIQLAVRMLADPFCLPCRVHGYQEVFGS